MGGIVPHAGYEFSGPSAVHFFNTLKGKDIRDCDYSKSKSYGIWGSYKPRYK
ncbi:AmmeMemoRadiSam system protein B [Psychrilyobacter sp.]|uniref:AmmeMemoRadiSam system protein B n=1 Tax=Psychrilyobacter sp. TaxID=2586924 RepID=UPI0030192C37